MLSRRVVSNAVRVRSFATVANPVPPAMTSRRHKVVIVGGGSAGLTIGHQLQRSSKFAAQDIAIVDPAQWHHYQPGWTLVGGGLKDKTDLRKPLKSLVDPKIRLYQSNVEALEPQNNLVSLDDGRQLDYDHLVVCPGINVDLDSIKGLPQALRDPHAPVSSIYSYQTCDKVYRDMKDLKKGRALFTHPAGPVKCAGAPQKIMWLALDGWKRAKLYGTDASGKSGIQMTFATAMPVMFGVPKYSKRLEELREERAVEGLFQHDLVAIEGDTALFARPGQQELVKRKFDMLHAVPKMGPHGFVKSSPLSNQDGFVDVDQATLRHPTYDNVWSCGDAAGLQTSKTAAAITAQAPVVVQNILSAMDNKPLSSAYDGYTSCPLLTEYGKVMLAEFAYGGAPRETFGTFLDQAEPRRAFYHLKKDFFPWVYYKSMIKGTWAGPKGWKW